MKEVLRTNDPVELSWVQHVLAEAGIRSHLLDQQTSVLEGSIGAIQRRLLVSEESFEQALHCLHQARAGLPPSAPESEQTWKSAPRRYSGFLQNRKEGKFGWLNPFGWLF